MAIKTGAELKTGRDFSELIDSVSTMYSRIKTVAADTVLVEDDCGKIVLVNPTATTLITLPTIASVDAGWNVKVVLHEGAAGADEGMDQKVNIDLGSGANLANVGQILAVDGDAGDQAVANDDFIACSAAASPGDSFDFFTDGNRWYIKGLVADASETPFATAAG